MRKNETHVYPVLDWCALVKCAVDYVVLRSFSSQYGGVFEHLDFNNSSLFES